MRRLGTLSSMRSFSEKEAGERGKINIFIASIIVKKTQIEYWGMSSPAHSLYT